MCEKPDKDQTTVAPPTNAACSCAAGWLALGSLDTGSCYKRGESSAGETWAAARTSCQVAAVLPPTADKYDCYVGSCCRS